MEQKPIRRLGKQKPRPNLAREFGEKVGKSSNPKQPLDKYYKLWYNISVKMRRLLVKDALGFPKMRESKLIVK